MRNLHWFEFRCPTRRGLFDSLSLLGSYLKEVL
jgi:hypothetical protein